MELFLGMVLKLAEAVSSRLSRVKVQAERCSRVRSIRSQCNRCLEVCPTGGLSWAEGRLTLDSCLECGLCTAVCPTGALSLQEPDEGQIINRAEELGEEDGSLLVGCHRHKDIGELSRGLVVPCLGALSTEFLLLVLARRLPIEFFRVPELCASCRITDGGELFHRRLLYVQSRVGIDGSLVRVLSNLRPVLKLRGAGRNFSLQFKQRQRSSRRELFSVALTGLRALPTYVSRQVMGSETESDKNRKTLKELPCQLSRKKKFYLEAVKSGAMVNDLYPQPKVAGTCFFCRACAVLCPAGCLRVVEEKGGITLQVDSVSCTSCGLCVEVCWYGALAMTREGRNSLQGNPIPLADGGRYRCKDCGREFWASSDNSLCPRCYKRR